MSAHPWLLWLWVWLHPHMQAFGTSDRVCVGVLMPRGNVVSQCGLYGTVAGPGAHAWLKTAKL